MLCCCNESIAVEAALASGSPYLACFNYHLVRDDVFVHRETLCPHAYTTKGSESHIHG